MIIFLDIDGVMLPYLSEYLKTRHEDGDYHFKPECVEALNLITDRLNAKIVISSTWRSNRSLKRLQELFKNRGVTGEVIDITPKLGGDRGEEIQTWIDMNECDDFIIIDDEMKGIINHFPRYNYHTLRTNRYRGLDMYDALYVAGGEMEAKIAGSGNIKAKIHPTIKSNKYA
jgi:hypothetical protein